MKQGKTVVRVGLVQMCSGLDPGENVARAGDLIARAVSRGAQFVLTPEMTNIVEPRRTRLVEKVGEEADDPAVSAFAALARDHGIYLLAGSFALRADDGMLVNRSLLFAPSGAVEARYDKIHMFDADLGKGERYRESSSYRAGRRAVLARTPFGGVGMTVCYDLRFPVLYHALARTGAGIIAVPSAFTQPTGAAHWHVLLRARAIETGCYILAPAQSGEHQSGRRTFGHSLIVAPSGEVIADAGTPVGVIVSDLMLDETETARARIPALEHARTFDGPKLKPPHGKPTTFTDTEKLSKNKHLDNVCASGFTQHAPAKLKVSL